MRVLRILSSAVATATVIGGVPAAHAAVPVKQPEPTFSTTIKEGRKAARSVMKQTKATSVSVALVSKGKRVWSQGFGRVNKAGKKPSATTMYGVGSVSKTVTAIAVMQLVDAGKVSLDAPVVRYIPDFTMGSPQYRQITVRMLLNHSAGLPGTDYGDWLSDQPLPGYTNRVLAGLRTLDIEDDAGCDERVLQRLLHAGWSGGGAGFRHALSRLRVQEHPEAARDEAFVVSDFDTQAWGGGARHPGREGPAPPDPQRLGGRGHVLHLQRHGPSGHDLHR